MTLYERAMAWVRAMQAQAAAPLPEPFIALTEPRFDELALEVATELCRRFEGFYSRPYLCPAGVPTIGYGATYYLDGRLVKLTDPAITKVEAEVLLKNMLKRVYLPAVLKHCPNVRDPNRLAALVDFTFNLGGTNLKNSTLRRKVNAEQWDAVPTELRKWVRAGGKVLKGLVLRREAECKLI